MSVLAVVAVVIGACIAPDAYVLLSAPVVRYAAARLNRDIEIGGTAQPESPVVNPNLDRNRRPPEQSALDAAAESRRKSASSPSYSTSPAHVARNPSCDWKCSPPSCTSCVTPTDAPTGSGRAPGVPKKGQGLLVRSLNMPDARVVLDDARRHLNFEGIVTAGDVLGARGPGAPSHPRQRSAERPRAPRSRSMASRWQLAASRPPVRIHVRRALRQRAASRARSAATALQARAFSMRSSRQTARA